MKRDEFNPAIALQSRAPELTMLAHHLLLSELKRLGNGISPDHSLALRQLLSGFSDQGLHIHHGRLAYALPCGSGKTKSIVAWIAAQHRLGLGISVAVASQQIVALCDIKSELIEAGVPETLIGIRHTKGSEVRWPDTDNEDRPIMLGSHSRIRGKDEMPAFCRYKGLPRDLLIWDESLISADVTVLELNVVDTALTHFTKNGRRLLVSQALVQLQTRMKAETDAQEKGKKASVLTLLTESESEAALAELGRPYCSTHAEMNLFETAKQALCLMKHPISLLNVGSGDLGIGLMRYQIVVDLALENIAVLDASFVVRELCKADSTIRNGTTEAMLNFKSYEDVVVKHTPVSSGRYQFDDGQANRRLALQAAVDSVLSIPSDEHVLLFTYKEEGRSTIVTELKSALRNAGVNVDAALPSGRPRFAFSTWGRHTTDNSYAYCENVLLLGIVRMSRLALGANYAGQKDDLTHRISVKDLCDVELTELASNILQAANRGRCRLVTSEGRALPMTIHLLTKEKRLQPLLERAMPGLQWETVAVDPEASDKPLTRTREATRQLMAYLNTLSDQQRKTSLKSVYAATGIALGPDAKAEAMMFALSMLSVKAKQNGQHPWVQVQRSLVRAEE